MARTQARIHTSIWQDHDFTALSGEAQRLYLLALSQTGVSFCGVVSYTPRRWARLAPNTTVKGIARAVAELAQARFVMVDDDTEELWIRSFVKWDGVLQSPNLRTAMVRDYKAIQSKPIREGFLEGLPEPFQDGFAEGLGNGLPEGVGKPFEGGSRARSAEPPPPPPPPSSSSPAGAKGSENGSPVLAQPLDDDEERIKQAAQLLAERRLGEREAAKGPVSHRQRWLEAAVQRVMQEQGEELMLHAKIHPDCEPSRLVDSLTTQRGPSLPVAAVVEDRFVSSCPVHGADVPGCCERWPV